MDAPKAPETRDAQSSPAPTPYRDGKPLAEIIPPDRRRAKMLALVVSSMIAGVALWTLGGYALEGLQCPTSTRPAPPTQGYAAGRIQPAILRGPGDDVAMPPPTRSVVHVWLQGCQDCMPAFEAMKRLEYEQDGLGVTVPVINVAYGEADPTWAARYGVRSNLVFDVGGASVVKPLGIGTFTTLVLDANGVILHRDRPDRPGYRDRIRAAVGTENLRSTLPLDDTDPLADPFAGAKLDSEAVQRVVAAHQRDIKRTCWDRTKGTRIASSMTVSLTIDTNGTVVSTSTSGDDLVTANCVASRAKTWRFPAPPTPTTVNIPFKFVREE